MSAEKIALVVTSIASPNAALHRLAEGCRANDIEFIVIGDEPSPEDFKLEGCKFYSIADQLDLSFAFAKACPTRHYARKNIGYLLAAKSGATIIIETDDDNLPYNDKFLVNFRRKQAVSVIRDREWVNVYRYFTDVNIWPRGFRLDSIRKIPPDFESLPTEEIDGPIQQGLANEDPDVDAIFRLVDGQAVTFRDDRRVAIDGGWCPFNSQSTRWWREAFPLMYLPAYCPFRMTDIWRSFVAQRICRENGWSVLFHEPHVWQERNAHDLLRDFNDEIAGYSNNGRLCEALDGLDLATGTEELPNNMRKCYSALVDERIVPKDELGLLDVWLEDAATLMA
jgi:hypothetical protein